MYSDVIYKDRNLGEAIVSYLSDTNVRAGKELARPEDVAEILRYVEAVTGTRTDPEKVDLSQPPHNIFDLDKMLDDVALRLTEQGQWKRELLDIRMMLRWYYVVSRGADVPHPPTGF